MLYKDAVNERSNQKNLGTIQSSNLCTEIMEYTSPDEIAVCNLASVALNKFVQKEGEKHSYNHGKLFEVVYRMTVNLNRIIDVNHYPVQEAKNSNLRHRPIGIGVQGLADTFFEMRLPFESLEALELNNDIFETIYFAALSASKDLAKRDGPYSTYEGSPTQQGQLQFDLWGVTPSGKYWDWKELKAEIKEHGLRNSLLVAPMPTASTSQILGNNECFEPITSNIYVRRVLSGEFALVNKYLVRDLIEAGLWNQNIRSEIIAHNGSIQAIERIPEELKALYKTVWEIKQRTVVDMAAGARPLHRPGPEHEHPHAGTQLRQALLHALLRLEKGTQNRHVLPALPRGGQRRPVHQRQRPIQAPKKRRKLFAGECRRLPGV